MFSYAQMHVKHMSIALWQAQAAASVATEWSKLKEQKLWYSEV